MIKKLLLASVLFLGLSFFSPSNAEAKKVIAVLPFEVLSENVEYKQFGLGTSDTLSVALTNVPDFVMIERGKISSVMKEQGFQVSGFTDDKQSVKLGKIIGAEILITGTIQSFEKQFRIVASFIEVETGKILKAVKVTGNNIFDLQDKLASDLLENQNITISSDKKSEITKITKATQNTDAYSYFTTGKTFYYTFMDYAFNVREKPEKEVFENLKKSIESFDKAISIDSTYSLAYAGKADAQASLANFYYQKGLDKDKQAELKAIFDDAKKNAQKSIDLNPNLAQGYRSFGIIKYYEFKPDDAIDYLKKSITLNSNDMESYVWLSVIYFLQGNKEKDIDKKIESFQTVVKYNQNFTNAYKMLGALYLKKEMLKESELNFEKALKLIPNDKNSFTNLKSIYSKNASTYFEKKDFENSISYYNKLISLEPNIVDNYSNLGVTYFLSKNYLKAEEMYKKAIELDKNNFSYYYNLAILYDTIKSSEKSAEFYKKACDLGFKQACKN
ncbi:MAG: tetratricopeptide repeat protein [Cyanobacteriota bacterium]|mgnify:CR=1 FL=1